MNSKEVYIKMYEDEIAAYNLAKHIINTLGDKLTDSCRLSPSGVFWIHINNREDLATVMTLAPLWTKSPGSTGIDYSAVVLGVGVTIKAEAAALPNTCKMVEEEYEVPAQPAVPEKPATKAKRMVLKCEQSNKFAYPDTEPQTAAANAVPF